MQGVLFLGDICPVLSGQRPSSVSAEGKNACQWRQVSWLLPQQHLHGQKRNRRGFAVELPGRILEVGIPECVAAPHNLLPWRVQGQCASSGVHGCTDVRSCIVLDI